MADWLKCQISTLFKYRQNQSLNQFLSVLMFPYIEMLG